MSDTIPTPRPPVAMTIGECVRETLEIVRDMKVRQGRMERELSQVWQRLAEIETNSELIRNEVQRHGQVLAPAVGVPSCDGGCRGR